MIQLLPTMILTVIYFLWSLRILCQVAVASLVGYVAEVDSPFYWIYVLAQTLIGGTMFFISYNLYRSL